MKSFDHTNPISIETYGKQLVNKSFRDILKANISQEELKYYENQASKGSLGHLIEKYHYSYEPNSDSNPDFEEAGVELKVTPYKRNKNKTYSAKERLVLNIINYDKIVEETFYNSSFWLKNQLMLLVHYLYEDDKDKLDYFIRNVQLFEFPKKDLKIIYDDWHTIKQKVVEGKAHELSESDTNYLGACTKGANSSSVRNQPFSTEAAKQRAFSLKSSYMTYILKEYILKKVPTYTYPNAQMVAESSVTYSINKNAIYNEQSDLTLDEYILSRFTKHYGKVLSSLVKEYGLKSSSKSVTYSVAAKLFNIELKDIRKAEEIEKANIKVKAIRVSKRGKIVESMSFPAFKYTEIVKEVWETSGLREMFLETRFLFIVFQEKTDGDYFLDKAMFWRIPHHDLDVHVRKVWEETVKRIKSGNAINLPKKSDPEFMVSHVRPHARDSSDTFPTPYGTHEVKKCFWLNNDYILNQIIYSKEINYD